MLEETLSKKTLNELCEEFETEIKGSQGKYKNDFNFALKMGEDGEKVVRAFLESLDYIFLSKCEDINYDYKFLKGGKEYIFEIKTDIAHLFLDEKTGNMRDTGNLVVEYESRGKKSGISATKADYFVTYFPQINEIWLIKVDKLKEMIREHNSEIRRVENAGDKDSNTKIFLISREKYKTHFRIANPKTVN